MKTMSLSRILVDLKTIDKKLEKLISPFQACSVLIGGKLKSKQNINDCSSEIKSEYQKINDLLNYRIKLKSALIIANSSTFIKIKDDNMTIAEAIEYKSFIKTKKKFLESLKSNLYVECLEIERHNEVIQPRLDKLLEVTYGKDQKVKSEEIEIVKTSFLSQNEAILFDPINIRERIRELEEEISQFESNIDIALSEENAKTFVKIDD